MHPLIAHRLVAASLCSGKNYCSSDDECHLGGGGCLIASVQWNIRSIDLSSSPLFNLLIGWQLYIWICCKPFFSLLYNCQLLYFWRLALSIIVEVFPLPFFPNIAPSRMFNTNSLCLTVCPIHEWRLFLKCLKVIFLLSPFEKLHHSLFYLSISFSTFFSNSMFQMH